MQHNFYDLPSSAKRRKMGEGGGGGVAEYHAVRSRSNVLDVPHLPANQHSLPTLLREELLL